MRHRQRWQIELFFRWLKCLLDGQHWRVESAAGVAIQVPWALITGRRRLLVGKFKPSLRVWELRQFPRLRWASAEAVAAELEREERRRAQRQKA